MWADSLIWPIELDISFECYGLLLWLVAFDFLKSVVRPV